MMHNLASSPSIGVLIVSFNQYRQTAEFIQRFLEFFGEDPSLYLLVLDNNSNDESYNKLRENFPTIDIRPLNDNYGCVTGRNVGIVELDSIGCKYIYVSDNDIIIEDRDFFSKLTAFHELHREIDASCPVVLWGDDRSVQTVGTKRVLGSLTKNITVPQGIQRVASLPGCAQFVRIDAFKKYGLYDNDFTPVSIEDYEWGIRATSMGAVLVNCPDVQVVHLHDRNRKDSVVMQNYYLSGRMKFLRKHFSLLRFLDEIRFSLKNFRRFGLRELSQGYMKGFRSKLIEGNHEYERFKEIGLDRYYVRLPKAIL